MGLTKKQRKQSWKLNRTPIVGLKKFRFDDRRYGFIMCADRRKRYDDEFSREALKLIQAGAGGGSLARRLPCRCRPRDNGSCCTALIASPGVEQPPTFV